MILHPQFNYYAVGIGALSVCIFCDLSSVDIPLESRASEHWRSTENQYEQLRDQQQYNDAVDRISRGEGSKEDHDTVLDALERGS